MPDISPWVELGTKIHEEFERVCGIDVGHKDVTALAVYDARVIRTVIVDPISAKIDKYVNDALSGKVALWERLRERFAEAGEIVIPTNEELVEELRAPNYLESDMHATLKYAMTAVPQGRWSGKKIDPKRYQK